MPRIKTNGSHACNNAASTGTAASKEPSTTTPQAPSTRTPATASRPRRKARLDVDAVTTAPPASKLNADTSKPKPSTAKSPASLSTASKSLATKSPAVRSSTAKPSPSKPRVSTRPSALDAAAQVLAGLPKAEAREGITAPDLIDRMTAAKLWTSPGGKTPAATLYSAMIREIARKGDASRFTRVSPGRFTTNAGASPSASRSRPGDRDLARADKPSARSTTAVSATSKPAPTSSRKAVRS